MAVDKRQDYAVYQSATTRISELEVYIAKAMPRRK